MVILDDSVNEMTVGALNLLNLSTDPSAPPRRALGRG
jgi:hypothetical protein